MIRTCVARTGRSWAAVAIATVVTCSLSIGLAPAANATPAVTPTCAAGVCTVTFTPGATSVFVVPATVTSVTANVAGGAGGSGSGTFSGGAGGALTATIPVTPGDTLTGVVGQRGANGAFFSGLPTDPPPPTSSAFGGGGAAGSVQFLGSGGGGGGGSFLFNTTTTQVLAVAGGGGGAGQIQDGGKGGSAGANVAGQPLSGAPAQATGGSASAPGQAGGNIVGEIGSDGTGPATPALVLGMGGNGDAADPSPGGGGGYYGGGGGGAYMVGSEGWMAAGGGGSGYLTSSATLGSTSDNSGAGSITLTYPAPPEPQAISFSPAPGTVGTPATLSATGGASGNPVVFTVDATSDTGVCNLGGDGITLSYAKAGSCVVNANQDGNTTYADAPQVQKTITVAKASFITGPTATITGTPQVGWTLTAGEGSPSPTADSYTYKWYADSVAIGGATDKTFELTTAQNGAVITVVVTAVRANYTDASDTSDPTSVVTMLPTKHLDMDESTTKAMIGKVISVTVKNLSPGEPYSITIGGTNVTTGNADSKGKVKTTVQVPTTLPAGKTHIEVVGSQPQRNDSDVFAITHPGKIDVELDHGTVKAGKTQKIKIEDLHPGEIFTIEADGIVVMTKTADNSGKSSYTLSVGAITGTHTVKVTGQYDGRSTTKSFKVK